jgi:hypothetical protein
VKQTTTKGSLKSIDDDLLSILRAESCPLPPETAQGARDPSQGYRGTAEDLTWALQMRKEAKNRATERDRAEARKWAEAQPAVNSNDPAARSTSVFLRKMQMAEDRGLAEWDGTKWRLKSKPKATPTTENREYPPFTESMIISRFHKARKIGRDRWTACCPAHDDHNPSLTITRGTTRWLFMCWSHRCSWIEILQAAGLGDADTRIGVSR